MKNWIKAARLRTLPLSLSGIFIGGGLSLHFSKFDLGIFLACIFTTVALQVLSNFANDYGDGVKGTDKERIGPARMLESGAITPKQLKNAMVLWSILSFLGASYIIYHIYLNNGIFPLILFFGLTVAAIIAAILYTVGKKAYGYKAMGDIFVFLFFGLVAVCGSYFAIAHEWSTISLLPAITVGCLSVAVLNLNNMRDIENDLKNNKITIAGLLGLARAKYYHYSIISLSAISWLVFILCSANINYWTLLSFAPFIILLKHLIQVSKTEKNKDLDPFLKVVALNTFFIAFLYFITTVIGK